MIAPKSSSPPRPRQVVQIGVIGHRPNRLSPEIAVGLPRQCERVLTAISQLAAEANDPLLHAPGAPLLRIISPLAEGADRIVAAAGLAVGADLQCPLPFHAGEYSRDFKTAASKDEFNALLARASSVFEADGRRSAEAIAYERVGQMVIEQSDLLIVIWDGAPAAGRGGTAQMVGEALEQAVPIVWLHASEAAEPQILQADENGDRSLRPLDNLPSLFAARRPETPKQDKKAFDLSHAYFAEKHPRFNGGRPFTFFRDLVAKGKLKIGSLFIADFETTARDDWQKTMPRKPELPRATEGYLLDKLCPHYAWADGLSTYYGGLLRSGSLATNLLSALAVFVALLGPLSDSLHIPKMNRKPSVVEFVLIAAILSITYWGRHRRWHERWLNYRQLGERLRQYCFLAPLGCSLPTPRHVAHSGSDPSQAWVDGMFHSIARDIGIAPGRVEQPYLASIGELIGNILQGQIVYHEGNHEKMEKLNHHLHQAGTWLFGITLLACIYHVWVGREAAWLLVLATAPPAFGAAFYGIANQGEFARSADRSLAMRREFASLRENDLKKALSSGNESFANLRIVAEKIAEIMISETNDWSVVFRYRSLNLPG
jgi:hypothetical protein